MFWVAVILSVIFAIIGIFRWKRANDPLYAMNIDARKAFVDAHKDMFFPQRCSDDRLISDIYDPMNTLYYDPNHDSE